MFTHILPQYKPHPTNPTITGYRVWGWIGHPLLGEVIGTANVFPNIKEARKYARELRLLEVK